MPVYPEPCLKDQCRSPVACEGFGYCRERNAGDAGAPTEAQQAGRRNIAWGRRIRAERLSKRGVA